MTDTSPQPTAWSPAARELWTEYTDRIRRSLQHDDADPEEVINDLHNHLREEQIQKGLLLLSRKDMLHILQRIGLPEVPITTVDSISPKIAKWRLIRRFPAFFGWIFLVALPAVSLLDEFIFSDATIIYHNVFPSLGLMILASLVPVQKAMLLWKNQRNPGWIPGKEQQIFNGLVTMVSLWYTLILLPMIGLGFVAATLFFWTGIGLLGLLPSAPFFSCIHGLMTQIKWNKSTSTRNPGQKFHPFGTGMLTGLGLLLISYVPTLQEELVLQKNFKLPSELSTANVKALQFHFSDRALWKRLFGTGSSSNPIPFIDTNRALSRNQRPEFFYRVTGKAPDSFSDSREGFIFAGMRWDDTFRDWGNWDNHQGQQVIGNPNRDLSMKSWRMDSSIDAEGMLAYTEWTMVLGNASERNNIEARMLLQTPPGAVVSRVTLWINGEPQEAAFGGRDQTIRAYQSVVRRNRDPLLVTQKGLDHVLAQCFPILPGQEMKIRIGFTSPLLPEMAGKARFQFPKLIDSNIGTDNSFPPVDVWIESDAPITWQSSGLSAEEVDGEWIYPLEYSMDHTEMAEIQNQPQLRVPSPLPVSYATSDKLEPGLSVVQRWQPAPPGAPDYVLVLDTSVIMKELKKEFEDLLKSPPSNLKSVVLAGFETQVLTPEEASKAIRSHRFIGAPPQVPALELAFKEARKHKLDDVLWIYAPSPFSKENGEAMVQLSERRTELPLLHVCPVVAEPSPLFESLNAPFRVSEAGDGTFPNAGRLETLFSGQSFRPHIFALRELGTSIPEDAEETSDHLVRLWVKDQIDRSLSSGSSQREMGKALGIKHQLVTPLTGAVVLETAAQYKANNLEQADTDTVPGIPEPSTWLLALVLMFMIFWLRWRSKTCPA